MKHTFSIVFLFLFVLNLSSQEDYAKLRKHDYHILDSVLSLAFKEKNINHIDKLISSGELKTNEAQTELICRKAMAIDVHEIDYQLSQEEVFLKSKQILNLYDSAYNHAECLSQMMVKYYRYAFLSDLVNKYHKDLNIELANLYKSNKAELIKIGLKPELDGFGLGAYFMYGKENWLGLEFSIYNYYKRVSTLRNKCNEKDYYWKVNGKSIFAISFLTFGYTKSIKAKKHDFSFSLIDINAPFVLTPAKFGFITTPESDKKFYYRPGIGLSAGPISATYSYNLMFSKSIRKSSEKHLLILKLAYPITNHRYRTK